MYTRRRAVAIAGRHTTLFAASEMNRGHRLLVRPGASYLSHSWWRHCSARVVPQQFAVYTRRVASNTANQLRFIINQKPLRQLIHPQNLKEVFSTFARWYEFAFTVRKMSTNIRQTLSRPISFAWSPEGAPQAERAVTLHRRRSGRASVSGI